MKKKPKSNAEMKEMINKIKTNFKTNMILVFLFRDDLSFTERDVLIFLHMKRPKFHFN